MNCFPCKGPACNACGKFTRTFERVARSGNVRCAACGGAVDLAAGRCLACGAVSIAPPGTSCADGAVGRFMRE